MDNSEHDEHLHFPSSDEDGCQRSRKNVKNSPTEWDAETLELASQYGYSRSDLDTEGLEGEFDEELEEEYQSQAVNVYSGLKIKLPASKGKPATTQTMAQSNDIKRARDLSEGELSDVEHAGRVKRVKDERSSQSSKPLHDRQDTSGVGKPIHAKPTSRTTSRATEESSQLDEVQYDVAGKDEQEPPKKRGRGRPRKVAAEGDDNPAPNGEDEDKPVRKRARGRPRKVVSDDNDNVTHDAEQENVEPVLKRGRGRPCEEVVDNEDDGAHNADSEDVEPVLKRGRGRPRKADAIKGDKRMQLLSAVVYLAIAVAPIWKRGKTHRGDKLVQQKPLTKGPFTLTRSMKWNSFLGDIASTAGTSVENLQIDGMSWAFQKQKDQLPLTNKEAFRAMRKMVKSQKDPSSIVIMVHHPALRVPRPQIEYEADSVLQDRGSTENSNTHWGEKINLDQTLEPIVAKLQDQYPVDNCAEHPGIRCSAPAKGSDGWHIHLDEKRLKVWAHSIVRKHVGYDLVPYGRNFFTPKDRINPPREPGTSLASTLQNGRMNLSPMSPTPLNSYYPGFSWPPVPGLTSHYYPPAPPSPFAYGYGSPMTPSPMNPWGYSQPGPMPYHPQALPQGHPTPRPAQAFGEVQGAPQAFGAVNPQPPVHAPPQPTTPVPNLEAWCQRHSLGREEHDGLSKLGFRIGTNAQLKQQLDNLNDATWNWAGLGPLHQMRIKTACEAEY